MEYLKNILKKTGWASLIESIFFAIIGIILINNPEGTISFISTILGITFIIIGAYKIINRMLAVEKGNIYDNNVIFGIMAVVIGIITIVFGKQISTLFSIVIGVWIIYSAILRIGSSMKLKEIKPESKLWIISLVLSILMLICGIYIVANSAILVATIGVFILIYSLIDIFENIIFLYNIK